MKTGRLAPQRGYSLIEFIFAMAVSMIAVAAISTATVTNLKTSRKEVARHKLDHQLRQVMDVITRDVARAGYWANSSSMIGTNVVNPYAPITSTATCIAFMYNRDTPTPVAPNDDEKFGYALSNGTILSRVPGAPVGCADFTGWSPLTDPNVVNITAFSVTQLFPNDTNSTTASATEDGLSYTARRVVNGNNVLCVREFQLSLTGNLVLNSGVPVTQTLQTTVRVRNDWIQRGAGAAPNC